MDKIKLINAQEKDIELLTSMKLVTMISDEMDKKLSHKEKDKIKGEIIKSIESNYEQYKMIYQDNTIVGAYLVIPYKEGMMLDHIFVFYEHRGKGIATQVLDLLKETYGFLYTWAFSNDDKVVSFFKKFGFTQEKASGRTTIFKYACIFETFNEVMKSISLGYKDRHGSYHFFYSDKFREEYYLQNGDMVKESGYGLCFDQVELERYIFLKRKLEVQSYFLLYPGKEYAHTFLVFQSNTVFYWLENAWYIHKGIHVYSSLEELLSDVKKKFYETIEGGKISQIKVYRYEKPRKGISYSRFLTHVLSGEIIK